MTEQPKRGRGRPPGSKNKTTLEREAAAGKAGGASAKPGSGHNRASELTQDERRALVYEYKRRRVANLAELAAIEEERKEAKAVGKTILAQAVAVIGPTAAADIEDLIAADEPGGEKALLAEVERKLGVLALLGRGAQLDLFRQPDRTPAEDLAYEHGFAAGAEGATRKPPHDPSVPQYTRWTEGWNDGQAALASAFKKLEPADAAAATTAPGGEPSSQLVDESADDARDLRGNAQRQREADRARAEPIGDAAPTYAIN
jgi:hypothetical protein